MNRKSNWSVGEAYTVNTNQDPKRRNIHDPDNKYSWAEEEANAPAWVWVMRAFGGLGFLVGIYCLVFLGMLL